MNPTDPDKNAAMNEIDNHLNKIRQLKESLASSRTSDVKMTINPGNLPQIEQLRGHQDMVNRTLQKLILDEIAWREREIERLQNNGVES